MRRRPDPGLALVLWVWFLGGIAVLLAWEAGAGTHVIWR